MPSYAHFSLEERRCLEGMRKAGHSQADIARELGRSRSTISRELKRNGNKDGGYNSWRAHSLAVSRQRTARRERRIEREADLYVYVKTHLVQDCWSPEIIAACWGKEHPERKVGVSTLYRAIREKAIEGVSRRKHLRYGKKKRRGERSKYNTIKPDHTIHERPEEAARREEIGHWEGDSVRGSQGRGGIVTLVDRCSNFLRMRLATDNSAEQTAYCLRNALSKEPSVRTITLDNGSEFAQHRQIAQALGTTVYFADPHSPWQRPVNENINGLIRFFFPKGTDMAQLTPQQVQQVEDLINDRPRKRLNWKTPREVYAQGSPDPLR